MVNALASIPLRVPVLIDTAVVPAGERLDFWMESTCATYVPLQIRSKERGAFWARMWAYELGPLHVYRIAAAANTMIRSSRAVAAGDPECIDLSVVLRGQLNSAQQGRSCVARTGDVISKETSHPAIQCADHPFETVVVRVPRTLLRGHATQIDSLTAVTISGKTRLAQAAAKLLPRAGRRARERHHRAGRRAGDRRERRRSDPEPLRRPLVRGRAENTPVACRDPARRRVVHRGEPR